MAYEPVQAWELQRHTRPRKGTVALRDSVLFLFGKYGITNLGIYNRRPVRGGSSWSVHAVGRAIDFGTPNDDANRFLAWVLTTGDNPGGCGVSEVISVRRRWTEERGWQPYGGRDPHTSHVHVTQTIKMADHPASHDELCRWYGAVLLNGT